MVFFFKYRLHNNPKLAEQLMFGSSDENILKINQNLWKKFDGNRFDYYLNIVKICGKPYTPRARYVIAMAYSWNSTIYCKEAIKYLELYLSKELYKDKCVSNGTYSTQQRTNLHLAEMYNYLGNAYRNSKDYDNSIKSYNMAIKYAPNYLPSYLKLSEIYSVKKDFQKSIELLDNAKHSKYAKFTTGQEELEELFLDINIINKRIDEYKQKLYIETNYPYTQKQVREIVTNSLCKDGININFTQPKFKNICDYFKLKNNNKYFYKYPELDTYRCSQKLIELLTDSFLHNKELLEYFKLENKK